METSVFKQAVKLLREQKKYRRWLTTFLCLAVLVTLGTVAALKMNGQALNHKKQVLNCQLEIHEHTDSCYDGEKLVCGYADYVVHTHNDDCYGADGELVCQLPEVEAHEHTEDCYEEEKVLICGLEESETEVHEHTEDCYIKERGELICGEEEGGGAEVDSSSDESESSEDSDGGEEAEDGESEEPEARSEESSGHEHTDDCYEWNDVLACEAGSGEEGHIHTNECYETRTVLTCGKTELHTHDESCYDENGNLTCGLLEVKEHIHGEECFETVDMTDEEVAGLNAKLTKTFEDDYVRVTAEYSESADLPKDAVLKVEQITDEEHFAEREAQLREEMDDENVTMGALMNIGFYVTDEETGKDVEVEPKDAVSITIQFLDDEGFAEGDPVTIVHFADEGMEMLDGSKIDGEKATTFETSSFSDYGVMVTNEGDGVPVFVYSNGTWTEVGSLQIIEGQITNWGENTAIFNSPSVTNILGGYGYNWSVTGQEKWILYSTDGIHVSTMIANTNGYWISEKSVSANQLKGIYYLPNNTTSYNNKPLSELGGALSDKEYYYVLSPGNTNNNLQIEDAAKQEDYPKQYENISRQIIKIKEVQKGSETVTVSLPDNNGLGSVERMGNVTFLNDQTDSSKEAEKINTVQTTYRLAGWYNVADNQYYSVEDGPATAEINLNNRNVFYADWIGRDYNTQDSYKNESGGLVQTQRNDDFIRTRVYDYNDLFNVESATMTQGGDVLEPRTWYEKWEWTKNKKDLVFADFTNLWDQGAYGRLLGRPYARTDEAINAFNEKTEIMGSVTGTPKTYTSKERALLEKLFPRRSGTESEGVRYIGKGAGLYYQIGEGGIEDYKETYAGFYGYDSKYHAASYEQDDERFYIHSNPQYITDKGTDHTAFLPFSNGQKYSSNDPKINYHFGIYSEIDFYLPATPGSEGNKYNNKDMIFEFSGDDDVWVFLENKATGDEYLVLDLGGIHGPVGGSINFSTGVVTNTPEGGTTVTQANLNTYKGSDGEAAFTEGSSWTLKFYYLERGATLSNCKILFNIAPRYYVEEAEASTVSVKKEWAGKDSETHPNSIQVQLQAYNKADATGNPTWTDVSSTDVPDSSVTLPNENGEWTYLWEGLDNGYIYRVIEKNIPAGYTEETDFEPKDKYEYWVIPQKGGSAIMAEGDMIILNSDGTKALGVSEDGNSLTAIGGVVSSHGVIHSESVKPEMIWTSTKSGDGYTLRSSKNNYLEIAVNNNQPSLGLSSKESIFVMDTTQGCGLSSGDYRVYFEKGSFKAGVKNNVSIDKDEDEKLRVSIYMKDTVPSDVRNYTITNTKIVQTDIMIKKVDADDTKKTPIEGAEFRLIRTLTDKEGKTSYEYYKLQGTTASWEPLSGFEFSQAGTISISSLTLKKLLGGVYTLIEVKAPEGYEEVTTTDNKYRIDFTVTDGAIILADSADPGIAEVSSDGKTLYVKNKKLPESEVAVTFTKIGVDENGTIIASKLSGASFDLYRKATEDEIKDGKGNTDLYSYGVKEPVILIARDLVSDKNGIFYPTDPQTGKLSGGTYYLREKSVPDGYHRLTSALTVEIEKNDSNEFTVSVGSVEDDEEIRGRINVQPNKDGGFDVHVSNVSTSYTLPETGGKGTIPITMGSAILMTVSAFLLYGYSMRQKKRERRSNK